MRIKKLAENQGMALLITIMVISLLIAVTVQFNRSVRQNYFASAAQLDGQRLRMISKSGFTIAAALLEADGKANTYDTLQDQWAVIDVESFPGLFGRGVLNLEITDLSGKLQINSLVQESEGEQEGEEEQNTNENREILNRLLLSGTFGIEDEQEAREIVDALVDWLDSDDRESDFGAESSYYRSLENSYECQNGPVTVIEDLLLVKGITPELLFGDEDRPGLVDYITVYGSDGTININTASEELLQAMHSFMTAELSELLAEFRNEEGNYENLETVEWYRDVTGFPNDIELSGKVISTTSSYFKIDAEGVFNDQRRIMTAIVERNKENTVSFLYRKVE
ncbi:type II secretion system minor pseudopilin GspK [Desulfosediminicola flagellatus]|uniref:type II secretion system minor pseudopilin GspK n=1 Tax=Desulfosediminicola flagellatus TaxID=2569541 RepID=UPI0010AB91B9|nr:type II secretion system minor pseudopilin GspK [Desulfosediminicola flagellatus]